MGQFHLWLKVLFIVVLRKEKFVIVSEWLYRMQLILLETLLLRSYHFFATEVVRHPHSKLFHQSIGVVLVTQGRQVRWEIIIT
jgi:hypothetical protein